MTITVIDGGLGSGKTLTGVFLGYVRQRAGTPVYANFDLNYPSERLRTWSEVMSVREGLFIWDESHLDIDSRRFTKNVSLTPWLTQTRKLGVDLVVISQNINQIDIRLRQLTDVLIRCEKVANGGRRATKLWVFSGFTGNLVKSVVLAHTALLYSLYDTKQLVLPLAGEVPSLGAIESQFGDFASPSPRGARL